MDAVTLAALAGAVLSLVFSYFPKVRTWYDGLDSDGKKQVMGAALIVTAAAVFGLACTPYGAEFGLEIACTVAGAIGFLKVLIAALVANQAVYLITRKSKPVAAVAPA